MFRSAELRARNGGLQTEDRRMEKENMRQGHKEGTCAPGLLSTREAARLLLWKEFAERSAKPCAQGFWPPTSPELGTGCCGPNSVETLDDRSIT